MAFENFNPTSPTWQVLEKYLIQQREILVQDLIDCDTHDKSQTIRGRLQQIDEFLGLPKRLDNWEPPLGTR